MEQIGLTAGTLGDSRMDSDHEALVRLAQQIEDLLAEGGDTTTISGKLVTLYRLAEEHFSYEDTLMAAIPEGRHQAHVARHHARHAEFIRVVMAISARAKDYEPVEALRRMYGGVLSSLLAEMLGLDADLVDIVRGGGRAAGGPDAA